MEANGRFILSADQNDLDQFQQRRESDRRGGLHVSELNNQAVHSVYREMVAKRIEGGRVILVNGRKWFGHARQLINGKKSGIYLAIVSPFDELMVNARATRRRNLLIILSVMTVAVGLGFYLSRLIAGSLHDLSVQAESVRDFELSRPFAVHSRISEVDDLADTMTVMQSAINRFVEIARALSAEKQMERVLEMIVSEAQSITDADGGAIGLVSDDGKTFSYVLVRNKVTGVRLGGVGEKEISLIPLSLTNEVAGEGLLEISVVREAETKAISDVGMISREICSNIKQLHEKGGYKCCSLLVIPLLNRQDEVIGLLHLVNARDSGSG